MQSITSVLTLIFIQSYCQLSIGLACGSESYSVDNLSERYDIEGQNLLLYKTVNWWYDCLPEDNFLLCGKKIGCRNFGNARIDHTQSVLKISVPGGFADQLSIFKTDESRPDRSYLGPSYLRCIWQNEKYFGKGRADSTTSLNQFAFAHIDKRQADILKEIENDIVLVVEGHILGLTNDGKIALHNTDALLKKCSNDTPNEKDGIFPIIVTIKRHSTDEIIARYIAIWSD